MIRFLVAFVVVIAVLMWLGDEPDICDVVENWDTSGQCN